MLAISIHAPRVGCDVTGACFYGSFGEFQSTHPVWGATRMLPHRCPCSPRFQSTHPVWGATPGLPPQCLSLEEFQSTHPVWGATGWLLLFWRCDNFNPRTPCGVRPFADRITSRRGQFQSTHPVWGATRPWGPAATPAGISIHAPRVGCDLPVLFPLVGLGISIHAPRVGCDQGRRRGPRQGRGFQSTHPVWGATPAVVLVGGTARRFQSTHPVWGATPRSGPPLLSSGDFNPRTPCGVRHAGRGSRPGPERFQSTHPVWGATPPVSGFHLPIQNFNPRTPCGVRRGHHLDLGLSRHFNPRTPCGVRPSSCLVTGSSITISIHAPRVGCDGELVLVPQFLTGISIHAPRVGCDNSGSSTVPESTAFQSTHPVWGATPEVGPLPVVPLFQSTHPVWGATVGTPELAVYSLIFQSTHPVWGATLCL